MNIMGEKDGKVVNRHIRKCFTTLPYNGSVLLKKKASAGGSGGKSRRRGISEKALSQGRGVILLTLIWKLGFWEPGWVVKVILLPLVRSLRFRLFGDLWKS